MVNFYFELTKISLPDDAVTFTRSTPEVLNLGQEKAIPLISICPPRVKTTSFFHVLHQVAGILQKNHPGLETEIAQIQAALPVKPSEQELFVTQAFIPGTNLLTSLKLNLPPDTFGLLLNHTVKLFMKQYAKEVISLCELEQWLKGYCPVCGSRPSFAVLEKENGKRYLFCGLCEVKWRFQRLGCPYCFNNESQFFTVEGMDKYRVYFCEECRGYIKTLDEKKAGEEEIDLFWEDINTVHLDLLAISEGYFNKQADQSPARLTDSEK